MPVVSSTMQAGASNQTLKQTRRTAAVCFADIVPARRLAPLR
jgi:hypothetical protein